MLSALRYYLSENDLTPYKLSIMANVSTSQTANINRKNSRPTEKLLRKLIASLPKIWASEFYSDCQIIIPKYISLDFSQIESESLFKSANAFKKCKSIDDIFNICSFQKLSFIEYSSVLNNITLHANEQCESIILFKERNLTHFLNPNFHVIIRCPNSLHVHQITVEDDKKIYNYNIIFTKICIEDKAFLVFNNVEKRIVEKERQVQIYNLFDFHFKEYTEIFLS